MGFINSFPRPSFVHQSVYLAFSSPLAAYMLLCAVFAIPFVDIVDAVIVRQGLHALRHVQWKSCSLNLSVPGWCRKKRTTYMRRMVSQCCIVQRAQKSTGPLAKTPLSR